MADDPNIGTVLTRNLQEEMQTSYMEYAMSVIISRALPDVRDGLKPVQRRILYAMQQAGATSASRYRKCAAFASAASTATRRLPCGTPRPGWRRSPATLWRTSRSRRST
ncbi:MAG: hypothetical protein E6J30_11975 [Chloroflexi bacterium]|nr:MAG: hypothetical protein E6J30_11975 [Chloroflexota bacterium]